MGAQETPSSKSDLKKNKAVGITIPDFNTNHGTALIKTAQKWPRNKHVNLRHRIKKPQKLIYASTTSSSLINGLKSLLKGKTVTLTSGFGKIRSPHAEA